MRYIQAYWRYGWDPKTTWDTFKRTGDIDEILKQIDDIDEILKQSDDIDEILKQ